MGRTTEHDLKPLAIEYIKEKGSASTKDLIIHFARTYKFTEDDLEESRSQEGNYKWMQIVRNFKSNKTLEKTNLIEYYDRKYHYIRE